LKLEIPFSVLRASARLFELLGIDPIVKLRHYRFLLPHELLAYAVNNLEHVVIDNAYCKPNSFKPRKGVRVLDAGAALGFYTVVMGKGGASVVALEPITSLASYALVNAELNAVSRAKILPVALIGGSGSREVTLTLSANPLTSSIEASHAELHGGIVGKMRVKAVGFDTLFSLLGPFDIVKLDVECVELEIVKKSEAVSRIPQLVVEVHTDCVDIAELCLALERKGFSTLVTMDPDEPYQAIVYATSSQIHGLSAYSGNTR